MKRTDDPIRQPIQDMVAAARSLQGSLLSELERRADGPLVAAHESLAAQLGRQVAAEEAADVLAQAVVCAGPILAAHSDRAAQVVDWISTTSPAWECWALREALRQKFCTQGVDPGHLFEPFLHKHASQSRKRHGVFFTPRPIADYLIRQIDQAVKDEFELPEGLSSEIAFLDPACGTGVFLLALIDHLHRAQGQRWNAFVPALLPRLVGIEILPVAAFLARLNVALKLAETGYDFKQPGRINVRLADALSPNPKSQIPNPKSTFPVILGNPPFSSLSTNTNPWIASLVRGNDCVRGYVQAGEHRLGERKTWLHDDYVKFLRLAQWHVEQAGRGIVGLVTNRGYLDNATFRLMRHELLRAFPHIRIVDLHGGRKSGAISPDGNPDENVFGLDQGIAIGVFVRSQRKVPPTAEYVPLWGLRAAKLATLAGGQLDSAEAFERLDPIAPGWRLVPTSARMQPEYDAGWLLTDAMPVHTPAPVTARDHFVVAFTESELCERIEVFRDLSVPDEEICRRFFTRTRSSRYPTGDTRSWKLATARRAVAADADWRSHIRRCLYRPFDWRYIFWHPAMIDWPRTEVTVNFEPGTMNLCLIARRQQLATQPCTFFWMADGLALDGVIRSDNRGSESLFPLWLRDTAQSRRPNFAPRFVEQVAERLGAVPPADDLLAYIYALFHSPIYRERYADRLRTGFPRVLLPGSKRLFAALAEFGRELISLHLLSNTAATRVAQDSSCRSAPCDGRTSPALEEFRVGGYVALKKWLQPKHRSTNDAEYQQITIAIGRTIGLMGRIDEAIADHGGFPTAF